MKAEIHSFVQDIMQSLDIYKKSIDWDTTVKDLQVLNNKIKDPNFWHDADTAQKIMRQCARLKDKISAYEDVSKALKDTTELLEIAEMENDELLIADAENSLKDLREKARSIELQSLLDGEADKNNCFLEIHAGAGGTESCDWVVMLLRMYQRWSDSRNFTHQIVGFTDGEEAGLKSVTLHIKGDFAYGWLKAESGVHRLVRISPFDSSARRHTSFSSISVYPQIEDTVDIEILEKDLKVDTYRASGAGGQHVNTTDSAVRITHVPTHVVVQCQSQRSQHKNRSQALKMLKAKLYKRELQKREEKASVQYSQKTDIGWGHQIRSYVLHPYQMVKDLRTGVENTNTQDVLDGNLNAYLQASLALL